VLAVPIPFDGTGKTTDYPAARAPGLQGAIADGVQWLKAAQDANPLAGISHYYTVGTGWSSAEYKEVTGYIIQTMLDIYSYLSDTDLYTRALAAADWEVSVQHASGYWDYVFDTGQVLLGLCKAYEVAGTAAYLTSIVKAADYLVSVQDAGGYWVTQEFGSVRHAHQSRVAWGLLRAWQITGTAGYRTSAIACLDWVLTQQTANGWYHNCNLSTTADETSPLTHTLSYTAQGLLESGLILSDTDYIDAAIKTADSYLTVVAADGGLTGGRYTASWVVASTDECLTGSAQIADVWWKLYHYGAANAAAYRTAAINMNNHLRNLQGISETLWGIQGGIAGSDPLSGAYMQNNYLSWACKFFLDTLYDEVLFS
jgi:hypothetical protein